MKRILIAALFLSLAVYIAFSSRSAADRSWAIDAPGGKIGYMETRRWQIPADSAQPTLVRSRAVILGRARFNFSETTVRIAGAGFGVLGVLAWIVLKSKEPAVNY